MGKRQRLTYDRRNNPTSLNRLARPGSPLTPTTVQAEWHASLNMPKRVTVYDALDRPIQVTAPWEAGRIRVSEVLYDPAGRKRIERSAVGTDLVQDSATYTSPTEARPFLGNGVSSIIS